MEERYYDSSSEQITTEEIQEDETHSLLNEKKEWRQPRLMLAFLGVGLVAVVMIFVWFLEKPRSSSSAKRISLLESKIEQLEKTIAKINAIDEKLETLENQSQKFMFAVDRLDRFETSISWRMEQVDKKLAALQKVTEEAGAKPDVAPPSPVVSRNDSTESYHTVSTGDTLYSISRRYGLTVEELRKTNKLPEGATIYEGQKLIIVSGAAASRKTTE
jgi:LysM repeat protein